MKRKEYVRGLGFGILITAIVFSFIKPEAKSMTEEEIIKYAVSLGYVKEEEKEPISNLDDIKSQAMGTPKPEQEVTPEPTASLTPTPTSEPEATSSPTPTLTSTPTPTNTPTPLPTSTPTPLPTSTPTPKPTVTPKPTASVQASKTYTLVVTKGMTATKVANLLAEAGVIDNSVDFIAYLQQQKLTDYIMIGSYQISYGASFKKIADTITWIP